MENQKVLIGLSGGINSMAVLCWLTESGIQPSELHLFYADFDEHSEGTLDFVLAGMEYAKKHFHTVITKVTQNSIIEFFKSENIIPHPANSPCSKRLKIEPISRYCFENGIQYDLVGYVKHELKKRAGRQTQQMYVDLFTPIKAYPIGEFTDEWCFEVVKRHIGWYPAIYDLKDENGKRLFKHNNCLPCKNMYPADMLLVKEHYPKHHERAMQLSSDLGKYWGRNEAEFYTTFGRELGQATTCESCQW